jgi:2-phospho-L-lactate guanylyltransferase
MSLWAIVPVKPLRRGKSRLSGVLTEEERTVLNFSMLGHMLKTLSSVPEIDHTQVVSRDPSALALAREYNARTVQEVGSPKLNQALRRATTFSRAFNAEGVLILPADLPLVRPEDIQALLQSASEPPVVVISPDRRKLGTNALLINPVGIIDYVFGPDSFQKHCELAKKAGVLLKICEIPSIGLDLDLPEDLAIIRQMQLA